MRNFKCGYRTLVPNPAPFTQAGNVQKRKFQFLDSRIHSKSGLETKADFTYQQYAITARCRSQKYSPISHSESDLDDYHCLDKIKEVDNPPLRASETNFWGAVGLIVGTAVGPGMLGLPSATIKSGPFPSAMALVFSWLYVISSILLIAELSFAVMKEDNVPEVSFTVLAKKTMGKGLASFAALVYASLSFSLLVACVSGIGSILSQCFPCLKPGIACGFFPSIVGLLLWLFPFKVIDLFNRFLCIAMLFSITVLVGVGLLVGRANILGSFGYASWEISSILPAIPVAVLTFGFHVITPFICKICGTIKEARRAILFGGVIPLLMVLSWNLIVLGLAGTNKSSSAQDPISLLLSVTSSVLPAVRGFAFSALATSLIGYVVSLPKQIVDTLGLIFSRTNLQQKKSQKSQEVLYGKEAGKVGLVTYWHGHGIGNYGKLSYGGRFHLDSEVTSAFNSFGSMVTPVVLVLPVLLASMSSSIFSRSLEYAGIYANCFLFGILPPLMMHLYQREKKVRVTIMPGGSISLLILFSISVVLAIWH
ncbi:OLC1v1001363C1 [Oldenlandia corymbosa var. corymbosa]|uniref:OLC1v1001363C1 n=1 Tax=Oldenlandia corymbosa var. corymbosa TaxID=529605 RepID=A0AAV1D7D7_OLDCO|nr:OLC1v1001363C1 [Oldenlandia corymbosa var. corymbosa]